jgi:hypothetical protein
MLQIDGIARVLLLSIVVHLACSMTTSEWYLIYPFTNIDLAEQCRKCCTLIGRVDRMP